MATREIVYPNYSANVTYGADIRLSFVVPGSKSGAVDVILIAADAVAFLRQINKAVDASAAMLEDDEEEGCESA